MNKAAAFARKLWIKDAQQAAEDTRYHESNGEWIDHGCHGGPL